MLKKREIWNRGNSPNNLMITDMPLSFSFDMPASDVTTDIPDNRKLFMIQTK